MDCQKSTTYLIKIKLGGKIYYQESRGEPCKAYAKKQGTYCLRCKKKQIINKLQENNC